MLAKMFISQQNKRKTRDSEVSIARLSHFVIQNFAWLSKYH